MTTANQTVARSPAAKALAAGEPQPPLRSDALRVSVGQYSVAGKKPSNQDFHGCIQPTGEMLALKGIAVAIADGISSSDTGGVASETAIKSFLSDYYCTSGSWTVKTSASRVIAATNSWLHAQNTRSNARYDRDRGLVTTFSAVVFKSTTAHVFHIGDARVWRLKDGCIQQLTRDHRVAVSSEESYLGRALGVQENVEIDYEQIPVEIGDVFVLTTDGVHGHLAPETVATTIGTYRDDLDHVAREIVEQALARGSDDNLTVQVIRITALAASNTDELQSEALRLSPPPLLEPGDAIDGYKVLRILQASSRSHVYVAETPARDLVVLKCPSVDLRADTAYRKRLLMEEWVARRVRSPHVQSVPDRTQPRRSLYTVLEYIEGDALGRYLVEHPRPDIATVRRLVDQIAKGLRAFHRLEMVHQDVRPENILITRDGTAKIIDFGSVKIAGVVEGGASEAHGDLLGTPQYTAPECILGEPSTSRSDLYGLGVIAYQMLTGDLPYGAQMAQARTRAQQLRVAYQPIATVNADIPPWIDAAIRRAVHPDPHKRQHDVTEFAHALAHPPEGLSLRATPPLIERNPVLLWQMISAALLAIVIMQALWS